MRRCGEGGGQPEGLERGYKCFFAGALHLHHTGGCILLTPYTPLARISKHTPRPRIYLHQSIYYHGSSFLLPYIRQIIVDADAYFSTYPTIYARAGFSRFSGEISDSPRSESCPCVCVHPRMGRACSHSLLYPPRIHTRVPQPTMRYCMMWSSLRQGDASKCTHDEA